MSAHAELLARHRRVLPSWSALYYEPVELVSGQGCVVTDGQGNRYLDLFGGILTTMSGHAVPEIVEAVQEQAARIDAPMPCQGGLGRSLRTPRGRWRA
jgi:4-aminobutyrate aminotransferase